MFVKLQLLIIDVEYLLMTIVGIWKLFETDYGTKEPEKESLYIKITYPINNLTSLMFLYYNWLYVSQYLKAALLLPILLTARQLKEDG